MKAEDVCIGLPVIGLGAWVPCKGTITGIFHDGFIEVKINFDPTELDIGKTINSHIESWIKDRKLAP